MRLPELRTILANCPKAQAFSIYDRCKVRYARYSRWRSAVVIAPDFLRLAAHEATLRLVT